MSKNVLRSIAFLAVLGIGFLVVRATLDAMKPEETPPLYRFLILGDATTVPMNISKPNRWPQQVASIFREENHLVDPPHILAKAGMGITKLAEELIRPEFQGPYDLVLVQTGANDIAAGMDPESYRVKFSSLLRKATARAGKDPTRVIVLSVPDWTAIKKKKIENRETVQKKIDRFNAINMAESSNAGVRYVDVTSLSRRAAFDPSFLSRDQKNPSERMYEIWARKIYPTALTALGR